MQYNPTDPTVKALRYVHSKNIQYNTLSQKCLKLIIVFVQNQINVKYLNKLSHVQYECFQSRVTKKIDVEYL